MSALIANGAGGEIIDGRAAFQSDTEDQLTAATASPARRGREAEAAAVIDALLLRFGDAIEPELRSTIVEVRSWKMARC